MDPLIGTVLDERYRIESRIGEGGIGRVYAARHLTVGNQVAVKVLLERYDDEPILRERFAREATVLGELSHPNIVKISDFGVADGKAYLVMELLEGSSLAELIEQLAADPPRGIALMKQVLRALAYAHERDIVHRDIKPHNVFVRSLGGGADHVQVLDFGLAGLLGAKPHRGGALTRRGVVLGTPAYMPPEQASGEAVDARADVYSVGVMLYELVTGRRPFEHAEPGDLLRAHILEPPPKLRERRPNLRASPAFEAVIERAMAKSPSERFEDASKMLEALDALDARAVVLEGAPEPARAAKPDHGSARTVAATPKQRAATSKKKWSLLPMLAVLGGCALVALVAIVGVSAIVLGTSDDEDRRVTEIPAIPPQPVPVAPPENPAADPSSPALRDPFDDPLPDELAPLHEQLGRGRTLSRRQVGALRRFVHAHHDDPRPLLILAHHYTDVRALSWALPRYEEALEIDPTVAGDEDMLPDLVEMARSGTLHHAAVDLIVTTYGESALEEVERQLGEQMRREERHRLEALRDQLTR